MRREENGNAEGCLWGRPLSVVNVGLELFGTTLEQQHVRMVHVDWKPPAAGRKDLIGLLDSLVD